MEKISKTVDAAVETVSKIAGDAPEAIERTVEVAEHLVTEVVKTPKSTKFLIGGLALIALAGTAGSVAYFVTKRKNDKAAAEALDESKSAVTDEDLEALVKAEELQGTNSKKK